MDKELNIEELIIKMRQLQAIIEDDTVIKFDLRDKLKHLDRLPISIRTAQIDKNLKSFENNEMKTMNSHNIKRKTS